MAFDEKFDGSASDEIGVRLFAEGGQNGQIMAGFDASRDQPK
jgi:hypothetical protein